LISLGEFFNRTAEEIVNVAIQSSGDNVTLIIVKWPGDLPEKSPPLATVAPLETTVNTANTATVEKRVGCFTCCSDT